MRIANSVGTDEAQKQPAERIEYNTEGDIHALAKKVLGTLKSLSPSEEQRKSSGHKQR
jgi:hypothetical protein